VIEAAKYNHVYFDEDELRRTAEKIMNEEGKEH